jgi:hypothetical protein
MLLLIGLRLTLPGNAFWSSDEGNKFIQVQSLAYSHASTLAIPYPGAGLDPSFKYFPDGGNHFLRLKGRIYSFYPFYFPVVTLPLFRWLGIAGLYILPLAGTLLTILATRSLLAHFELNHSRGAALFVFSFCTPFFFYSLTYWEHTLAAVLGIAALLCIIKKGGNSGFLSWMVAGILVGLSTILREEGYVFFAALFVAVLWVERSAMRSVALAFGWIVVLIPIWMVQKWIFGHWMGSHAILYRSPVMDVLAGNWRTISGMISNFYIYLFEFHPDKKVKLLLALPFIALLATSLAKPGNRVRASIARWLLLLTCCSSAMLAYALVTSPAPMRNTLYTQGFFPAAPFVLLAFFAGWHVYAGKSKILKLLFLLLLFYIAGTCVNLNQKYFGIIWGPRHFLLIYPLLVVFVWTWIQTREFTEQPIMRACFVVLCVVSLLIQGFGVWLLSWKLRASADFVQTVESLSEDVVITDAFWVPEDLSALFFRKRMLMVRSDGELLQLLELLKKRGVQNFMFVRSRDYHMLTQSGVNEILRHAVAQKVLTFPRLSMLNTAVYSCQIQDRDRVQ